MHENREISWTSWSKDQGRSAKAINRTAGMNVQEKSDCAVVPVNQPNNEGLLSAEAGEGRAQTTENIVQSHMSPTQSGEHMSQGLRGVRQTSKRKEAGTLHRFATPSERRFALGQLLRFEANSRTRSRWRDVARV